MRDRRDATMRLRLVAALPDDPGSCPALLASARDASPEVARAALRRLGSLGGPDEAATLRERLTEGDLALAADHARALRALGDARAVDVAIDALRAEPYTRALAGALALGVLRDPRAAAPLRGALRHSVAGVRRAALDALGWLGHDPASAAACARLLGDPSAVVRRAAVHATGRTAADRAAPLGVALRDPDPLVRRALAGWVADLAIEDAHALLHDDNRHVRAAAARSAGRALVPALAEVLGADADWEVRADAARTLGDIGDPQAANALGRALADARDLVRAAALRSLRRLGPERDMLAILDEQLRCTEPALRRATLHALARLETTGLDGTARALVADPDPDVRLALVHAASGVCRDPDQVIQALRGDPDATVRHAAVLRSKR